jgi:hypothetical protein
MPHIHRLLHSAAILSIALTTACATDDELDTADDLDTLPRGGDLHPGGFDVPPDTVTDDLPDPVAEAMRLEGAPVEFGAVGCEGRVQTRTITIVNPTGAAGSFTAQKLDGELDLEVTPSSGTVPAGGTAQVQVRLRDGDGSGSPRVLTSAVRIVTRLDAEAIHDVPVQAELRTAELQINGELDFGWVPPGSEASLPIAIINRGTAPAPLSISADPQLTVQVQGWIAPGGATVGWVRYRAAGERFTGKLAVSATGSCQPPLERAYSAGHGAFAVLEPVDIVTTPDQPVTSTRLAVSNPGDKPLEVRCHPVGGSPLALAFAQDSLLIPPGGASGFDITMAPGDGSLGTTIALVRCNALEGAAGTLRWHDTGVTRTVVAPW